MEAIFANFGFTDGKFSEELDQSPKQSERPRAPTLSHQTPGFTMSPISHPTPPNTRPSQGPTTANTTKRKLSVVLLETPQKRGRS